VRGIAPSAPVFDIRPHRHFELHGFAGQSLRQPRWRHGTTSGQAGARATPDSYTILFHSASFSSAYVTPRPLPYDTFSDFIAVAAVGISPSVRLSRRRRVTRPPPI
jgi:hypothetical protein